MKYIKEKIKCEYKIDHFLGYRICFARMAL